MSIKGKLLIILTITALICLYTKNSIAGYRTSGTYTSNPIDTGQPVADWGAFSWTAGGAGAATAEVHTAPDSGGSPGAWTTWTGISSGGDINASNGINGHQWFQYRFTLSGDGSTTPTVTNVTFVYTYYNTLTRTLISSKYDTSNLAGAPKKLTWTESGVTGGMDVRVQIRTADTEANLDAASWYGPTSTSDYYTIPSGTTLYPGHTDNSSDQWVQYQIFLDSDGTATPQLTAINLTYDTLLDDNYFSLNDVSSIDVGGARGAYTVTRYDGYGSLKTYGSDTVWLYTSSTGINAKFYNQSTGGSEITSVTIADGGSSAQFWYSDDELGIWTITASDASGGADGATGIDDATDSITVNDITSPTVAITSPTSSPTYNTTSGTINIGGSASDNVGVTTVTWSNDRGGSGAAAGTTAWSVTNIALLSGNNVITVSAQDAAGNPPGTDILTVTYNVPPDGTINTPVGNQTINEGGSVNFTGTGTDPDNDIPLTYLWDFDGGAANSTLEDPGNVTFAAPGVYNVTFTVTDSLGTPDPSPAAVTITVNDITSPNIAITSPTSSPTYNTTSGTINIGGSASDNVGVTTVTWSNDRGGSGAAAGTTSWSVTNIALLSGNNVITVSAQDAAGNPSGTDILTVTYHNPPDGTIDTPGGNQTINEGGAVNFTGTGTDPDGNTPLTYLWNFDGGAANSTLEDPGNVTFAAPGVYNVTFTVTDSLGGTDPSPAAVTITVNDITSPTIAITSPTSSSSYNTTSGTINIGGTASDNAGVTAVTWSNDRGGSGAAAGTTAWSVTGITLAIGDNIITAVAQDAAGNTGTDIITVTYYIPPTITIISPTSSATYSTTAGTIVISGTASDDEGVSSVAWSNDRGGSGTATGTTTWYAVIDPLQNGDNLITVTAQDISGNTGTDTLTVRYNLPPYGVIDAPTESQTIAEGGLINFSGSGADPDSNTPLTYLWDFDGGAANSTLKDPDNVAFTTVGTYMVTFTVTDSLGDSDPSPPGMVVTVIEPGQLIAEYHFDETAMDQAPYGTDVEDFSGNNNYGVAEPSMDDSDWVSGKTNNALNFDGDDDYVTIYRALLSPTDGLQPFTIAAWIKTGGGEGWQYRRPINITGSSVDQTDYQVLITVDTAALIAVGKMQSDGSDIRFISSGGVQLPYWIESGMNTNTTLIWVKVDSIPAAGTTIYMYYGNPLAAGKSNGMDTFDFFEDFEGALTGWTMDSITNWSWPREVKWVQTTSSYEGVYAITSTPYSAPWGYIYGDVYLSKIISLPASGIIDFYWRYGIWDEFRGGDLSFRINGSTSAAYPYNSSSTSWRQESVSIGAGANTIAFYKDDWSSENPNPALIDLIKVRKYVSPVPVVSPLGNEESGYLSGGGSGGAILSQYLSDDTSGFRFIADGGYLKYVKADTDIAVSSSSGLMDGSWHYVAVTKDNSGAVQLYIDGIADGSAGTDVNPFENANTVIGTYSPSRFFFSGTIDELTVYDRALSANEILSKFNAGVFLFFSSDTGYNSADGVDPDTGWSAIQPFPTTFTYKVVYLNQSNTPPDAGTLKVCIDGSGSCYTMSEDDPSDTDYRDGKDYVYSTTFPVDGALHDYYFQVDIAGATYYLPEAGPASPLSGPYILTPGEIPPDTTMAALYHLNETAMDSAPGGTDAEDSSGSGNHGTAEASMNNADWVIGKYGNALDFDGVDDYVDLNAALLSTSDGLQPHAIEAWIKSTGGGGGWQYRKPIPITGSSTDQTDYQVLVTVDTASLITASRMQADGADIRFYNSSGTELSYWIESGINTASTQIWVKVDLIPAAGATIYIYYGNPGAAGNSDARAVFDLFDDFESGSIDGSYWTTGGSVSPYWQTYTSTVYEGSYSSGNNNIGDDQSSWIEKTISLSGAGRLEFYWRVSSESGYDFLRYYINGSQQGSISGSVSWQARSNNVSSGSNTIRFGYYKDYSVSSGSDTGWIDKVTVRRYVSPEPAAGAPGTEENVQYSAIVTQYTPGASGRFGLIVQGGQLLYKKDGSTTALSSSSNLDDGLWHHVAAVKDSSGTVQLYIDGLPDGSSGADTTAFENTNTMIGTYNSSSGLFNGLIDEVAIYDRALTPAEILVHAGAGSMYLYFSSAAGYNSADGVDPDEGYSAIQPSPTTFTYKAAYMNQSNTPPDAGTLKVCIDGGSCYTMSEDDPADTDYTDGKEYVYQTTFPDDNVLHDYYFQVDVAGVTSYLPLAGPASPLSGPYTFNPGTGSSANALTVTQSSLSGDGNISQGAVDFPVERIRLQIDQDFVRITGIQITQGTNNTAVYGPDIIEVKLYEDKNSDGSTANESLLGTASYSSAVYTFSGLNIKLENTSPLDILVVVSLSPTAASGRIIQTKMNDGYITVEAPDTVNTITTFESYKYTITTSDLTSPETITDLMVKAGTNSIGPDYIFLKWTVPAGADSYDLRYSTNRINLVSNPGFEYFQYAVSTSPFSWTVQGVGTRDVSAVNTFIGNASFTFTANASNDRLESSLISIDPDPSLYYYFSHYLRPAIYQGRVETEINFYTSARSYISSFSIAIYTKMNNAQEWLRYSYQIAPSDIPDNAAFVKISYKWYDAKTPYGTLSMDDVHLEKSSTLDGWWDSATPVSGLPAPAAAGTTQEYKVTGLTTNTEYFFALKTKDNASPTPNTSLISNIVGQRSSMLLGYNTITVSINPSSSNPTVVFSRIQDYVYNYEWQSTWDGVNQNEAAGMGNWIFNDPVTQGTGYFFYLSNSIYKILGPEKIDGSEEYGDYVDIPLIKGWNAIGNPYTTLPLILNGTASPQTGVTVRLSGNDYDFAVAVANTWIGNSIYFWDGTSYNSSFYSDPGVALEPWKGYWLFAYVDGLSLRVYRPKP